MRETYMTQQDKDFMKLRDEVFKIIPQGEKNYKTWKRFREYMEFYYKHLKGLKEIIK